MRRKEMLKTKKSISLLGVTLIAFCLLAGCSTMDDVGRGLTTLGILSGSGSSGGSSSSAAMGCGVPVSGSNGSGSRGTGQLVNLDWPSDSDWARYGLQGLRQPSGSRVTSKSLLFGQYIVTLEDAGKAAYDNLSTQIDRMGGTLFSLVQDTDSELAQYLVNDRLITLTVHLIDMEILISASQ